MYKVIEQLDEERAIVQSVDGGLPLVRSITPEGVIFRGLDRNEEKEYQIIRGYLNG